jgi:EAL domain-containing protein (putative c-di-GMP-specific phosphodiesterase class I)
MPHGLISVPASSGLPAPRRLLVIDDQRLDRAITAHAASRMGFEASGAANISDARDLLESGLVFDFVVLDLSLGLEDGLEALPMLSRFSPATVVVFASGFDSRILAASQRVASGLGLHVGGVLRKPILPTALQRLLMQVPNRLIEPKVSDLPIAPDRIRLAIEDGQIRPWFQPKTSLASGVVVGTEALARWVQPDGRSLAPSQFIGVAERHGMIAALTDAMLDQALRACARWRTRRPDCWVAVNLSSLLLADPGLTDRIEQRLQAHGVPPGGLVLEITESNGIPDTAEVTRTLTRLRIRGVNLSIDDFGTGHSSLLSLVRMPFNEMKIDQAFVRDALVNRDSRKVVRAAASLGRELGLKVVAEGVETLEMAELVGDAGCHVGQGWLYGRAVPPDVFEANLAEPVETRDIAAVT